MEVKIYQDIDFVHKVFDPTFKNPQLDNKQRELIIERLKTKCTGCFFNNNGCATMQSIDDEMRVLDKEGEYISTEWCDAVGIGIEV